MKDKYQDDIHNATPERLAQMLTEIADAAMQYAKDNNISGSLLESVDFEHAVLHEAARRLRERQRPAFNHEQFE